MTKTDLFRVIIKIFGVYCFIEALFRLLPNISLSNGYFSFSLMVSGIYLLITALIVYILLFQTDRLIKLLRLEKGFADDEIKTAHLKESGLFKFALIVIGLLMITNNIAEFLNFCYLAFKKQVSANGLEKMDGAMFDQQLDYNWWFIYGLNVIIGIIILTNYKRISKLFVEKEKKVG